MSSRSLPRATSLAAWLLALIVGAAGPQAVQAQTRVEVFANSAMVIENAGDAVIYRLDGLQMLEAELSQGLPGDPVAAERMARARMRQMGSALHSRTRNAAQGLMLAHQYGVDRMPAMVIDGKSIVYGLTDVQQALRVHAAQSRQGGAR